MNTKSLLLQAFTDETLPRPPVWMMRQAGRYLSEYQELKSKYSFLEMCRTPELALEVSMQPVRILDVDAAIVFSDILIPFEPMGIEIDFAPGPVVKNKVSTLTDVDALTSFDVRAELGFVLDTISELKTSVSELASGDWSKGVLGFVGAPWTLACYLVDQGPYKHFARTAILAHQQPELIHSLLAKLADVISDYALAQHQAGADVVQVFDTWAGNLSAEDFVSFALPHLRRIFDSLERGNCPSVLYINGSHHLLPYLAETGASCISLDWRTSISEACEALPSNITIQGNLDPTVLFGSREQVSAKTREMLASVPKKLRYIANLGHGVLQQTPRENAKQFVDTIKEGW